MIAPAVLGPGQVQRVSQTADDVTMVELVVLAGGLVAGLALGRWWVLVASVGVGLWIAFTEEVEVPGVVLGVGYAALSALGIASGVLLRRRLSRVR